MTSSTAPIICGAVCRNFATGGRTWGILKRGGGGATARSVRRSTGRQCLKISLVILRGGEIDTRGGGGGANVPPTPKYTPDFFQNFL